MTEDAKERSRRYVTAVETALSGLKPITMPAIIARRDVERVVEVVKRYLSDSKYYGETGKDVTSLASISYAEGLLDALRFLKLGEFSWPQ
jgi:FAD synthetase